MSLTSSTQAAIALKNILGKSMTDTIKGVDNEAEGIFFNLDSSNIWVNDIPGTASIAVSQGVAIGVTASLTLDGTSNGRGYFASWPVAAPSGTDPITSLPYAYGSGVLSGITTGSRVRNGIPPSYGLTFEAKPYTGASLIPPGDARNWIYQYNSGVFFQQDVTGGAPSSIALYVYVGDTLSDFTSTGLGSITGVTAGSGLSGGGTQGAITLSVNLGANSGLTFSGNDIIIDSSLAGNGLDFTTGVLSVNTSEITSTLAGDGLTDNGSALDVNVNSDSLEINLDSIRLKDTITGDRTFQDSVTINGDLTVNGTVSYISTETILVQDNILTLNATYSGPYNALNTGIEANLGGGTYAALIWDNTTSLWSAGFSGSVSSIITEAGTGLTKSGNQLSVNFNDITSTGLTQNGNAISIDFNSITKIQAATNDFTIENIGSLTFTASNGADVKVESGIPNAENKLQITNVIASLKSGDVATFSVIKTTYNDSSLNSESNGIANSIRVTNDSQTLGGIDGSTGNYLLIKDNIANKGLVYEGDYTANFTTFSLVTKAYVDSAVSGVGATNGLTEIAPGFLGLGGNLIQDTFLNSDGYDLTIQDFDILTLTGSTVDVQLDNGLFLVDVGNSGSIDMYGGDVTIYATGSVDIISTNEFTVNTATGSITTSNQKGLVYTSDYSGTFVSYSLVSKGYVDAGTASIWNAIDSINGDFITGVTAGSGLSGGGTSGFITLDVNVANGLTINSNNVEVSPTIAGTGLTFSGGVLSVIAGASQPVYDRTNASVTTGDDSPTAVLLSSTPNDYSRIQVYVNGQLQRLGNGTASLVDCYISSTASVAEAFVDIVAGQQLYWNGLVAGYDLSTTDVIDIVYES